MSGMCVNNEKVFKFKCNNCGYSWRPRTIYIPDDCPKCRKVRFYKKEDYKKIVNECLNNKNILRCAICDYSWLQRNETKPKNCPKCRTRLWENKVNRTNKKKKIIK